MKHAGKRPGDCANNGAVALRTPSAALLPGGATGWKVDGGLQPAAGRDGTVLAVFGAHPDFIGWMAVFAGRPRSHLLARVHHLLPSKRQHRLSRKSRRRYS